MRKRRRCSCRELNAALGKCEYDLSKVTAERDRSEENNAALCQKIHRLRLGAHELIRDLGIADRELARARRENGLLRERAHELAARVATLEANK